jgi:omega-6 fatty acid desaturase (delta-12 desaturase)
MGIDDCNRYLRMAFLDHFIINHPGRRFSGTPFHSFPRLLPWRIFPLPFANRVLGYMTGILTFTPFEDWQRTHIIHHGASGNLGRRGVGDVWTLTVDEYLASSRIKRLGYRLFRNPLILFSVVPLFLFLIIQRFPSPGAKKRERSSVIYTNLAIAAIIILMSLTLGFKAYLLIQLPVIFMAATTGMWLFHVQHQYEDVYWARQQHWDLISSGLEGSSYYKLPKVLQWMAGNIGLHHIHHVRANIPSYNLQRCQNEVPLLQTVKPLTLLESFKSLWLNHGTKKNKKWSAFIQSECCLVLNFHNHSKENP